MNRSDIQLMAQQLNALAEVFDRKPVTEKAALVWFDTLREFPAENVMDALNGWPKGHAKFPTPNEVWAAVNAVQVVRRAERAARESQDNAANVFASTQFGLSKNGADIIRQMRDMFSSSVRAKPDKEKIAEGIVAKARSSEYGGALACQISAVSAMLGITAEEAMSMCSGREPGCDDNIGAPESPVEI